LHSCNPNHLQIVCLLALTHLHLYFTTSDCTAATHVVLTFFSILHLDDLAASEGLVPNTVSAVDTVPEEVLFLIRTWSPGLFKKKEPA